MANEFKIKNGFFSEGDSNITGSLNVSQGITGSLFGTSSWALNVVGGSGGGTTDTGSLLKTASVNLNTITFTKGDSSTFNLTIDTGSGGGGTQTSTISGSFIVWAEENGNLSTSTYSGYQFSFGNGSEGQIGIPMPFACKAVTLMYQSEVAGTSATIELYKNSIATGASMSLSSGVAKDVFNIDPVNFSQGDVVMFKTTQVTGTWTDVRVAVVFEYGIDVTTGISASYALTSSYALTASYVNTPQFSSVVELGGTLTISSANYNTYLGKTIILTGSSDKNFTLDYSPASPGLGDEFYVIQSGSGKVTASGSGVTLLSSTGSLPSTRTEYSSMAIKHIGSDRWIVVGDIT